MATLQDILSGNFPAAQRYAEGYAQMPSYLQDPYLGLSTSNIGNVTKGLLSKTQFEKAQELASKNAETLLGLPKGNTAMERAKAMGFTDNKWHETSAENYNQIINEGFDPNKALSAMRDEQTPYGIFVKSNPQSIGVARQSEIQMPLMTKPSNSLTFSNRYELQNYLNQYPELKTATENVSVTDKLSASEINKISDEMFSYGRGDNPKKAELWDKINFIVGNEGPVAQLSKKAKELITKNLTDKDINTINLLNDEGSFGRNVNTQIILDPRNIRSRFAAFDPAKANEPDLLSAAMAFPISGLLEQPKDKKKKK